MTKSDNKNQQEPKVIQLHPDNAYDITWKKALPTIILISTLLTVGTCSRYKASEINENSTPEKPKTEQPVQSKKPDIKKPILV